jgi:hypothetical protein
MKTPVKRSSIAIVLAGLLVSLSARAELYYVIVGGLGGDPAYDESFAAATAKMADAAKRTLGDDARITVLSGEQATRDALESTLEKLRDTTDASDRLAVFLVGHGSHDGVEYKFNLTGPDITGEEFAELLAAIPTKNQLVVNATSASGAVLDTWAVDGRDVITATRSGRERNATRFAEYWADALSSDEADLNKNGSISAQEAFDFASREVADSFETEGTLATEHPEIRGDSNAAFEVSRLKARVAVTANVQQLYDELDALNEQASALRLRRDELGDAYTGQMLDLQVQIARLQQQIDDATSE